MSALPEPPEDYDYADDMEDDDDVCPYCKADFSEICRDEAIGYPCRLNYGCGDTGSSK